MYVGCFAFAKTTIGQNCTQFGGGFGKPLPEFSISFTSISNWPDSGSLICFFVCSLTHFAAAQGCHNAHRLQWQF